MSARELVIQMGQGALRRVAWREGSNRKLQSRFVAVRVRPAHRDYWRAEPHEELWLLAEWPRGAAEPTKYWLANLPPETTLKELVRLAKHRWIVERDYLELKQELGLGHFEGRSWRGFHHHATLCIAAYGFLVAERSLFSPRRVRGGSSWQERSRRRTTGRGAARGQERRHKAGSIASIRESITGWLIRQLPCWPFCWVGCL